LYQVNEELKGNGAKDLSFLLQNSTDEDVKRDLERIHELR